MTKSHEVVAGAAILVVVIFIVWTLTRSGGGSVTPLAVPAATKPTQAGADPTLGPANLSGPITGTSSSLSSQAPPTGNSWVQGVDASGAPLGPVEIDSQGNYLTSSSKGPGTATLTGRGHF
jgi:hypothetical protein